jgi:hypothetical protein
MKALRFIRVVLVLSGILLSACSAAPASQPVSQAASVGSDKPVSEVVFTGVIEGMNGDQWIINGQTVGVDPSTLRDGPFAVGETVKVEARVAEDGSVTARQVESSSATAAASPVNTPEPASTPGPFASSNPGNETVGTVETVTDTAITINGQTYTLVPGTEVKGTVTAGTIVKLHFITNADGSLTVTELIPANPSQVSSSTHDKSNGSSMTDDHSSTSSSVDQSGDDHGGDDHSNDESLDDHGSGGSAGNDGSSHG